MKPIKFVLLLIISVFFGFVLSLLVLQSDKSIHDYVEKRLKQQFQNFFDCNVHAHLKNISFLSAHLEAENVLIADPKNQWQWTAKKITVSWSWLHLFFKRVWYLDLTFNLLNAESTFENNTFAISDHIAKMLSKNEGLPVIIRSLVMRKANFTFEDKQKSLHGLMQFTAELLLMKDRLKITTHIPHVCLEQYGQSLISKAKGSLALEYNSNQGLIKKVIADIQLTADRLPKDDQTLILNVYWNNNKGEISGKTKQGFSLIPKGILSYDEHGFNVTTAIQMPIEWINLLYNRSHHIQGMGILEFNANYKDNDVEIKDGSLTLSNVFIKSHRIENTHITFGRTQKLWNGTLSLNDGQCGSLSGLWNYDEYNAKAQLCLKNETDLRWYTSHWSIPKEKFTCNLTIDTAQRTGTLEYLIDAVHSKLNTHYTITGSAQSGTNLFTIRGNADQNVYEIVFDYNPQWSLKKILYRNINNHNLIIVDRLSENKFKVNVALSMITSWLEQLLGHTIKNDGYLQASVDYEHNRLSGTCSLQNAIVQLPMTYNFIGDVQTNFNIDLESKILDFKDLIVEFHKGKIISKKGRIGWNEHNKQWFINLPFIVEKVFINLEKDIFTSISGAALLHKQPDTQAVLKGYLSLDKGQLQKNILSLFAAKKNLGSANPLCKNIQCDLHVVTKKPLQIKTSFLNANATLDLEIKNSSGGQHISGSIKLINGVLNFPHKPLYLNNARLLFLPNQLYDPLIELLARGKVKRYQIRLRIDGSAQHPHISLESTPPLVEHQILALLLTGSEESSFASVMPNLLMQNMERLIFAYDQTETKVKHYFRNFLMPLKNIRIVPSFNDQSGRGGFRGAIEIDINDQLHGLIQKNFSQPEDTKFEVEYLLSDDITVRGIKDEHGDLGGEVEVRWKF